MNLPVRLHLTFIAISSSLYLSFCKSSSSMAIHKSLYHTEDVPQDMVDRRVEVVARLKSLEESAAPPISFLQNATLVQELCSDKQYNLQMLNDRFQIGAEQIEAFYQFAKFQFECGHYSGAADYLYQYRALCTDSERSLSALWGKLAAEILMQNWDVALEELNQLKEIIDSKPFEARRSHHFGISFLESSKGSLLKPCDFYLWGNRSIAPWRAMNLPVRLHLTFIAISSSLYLSFCKSSSSMAIHKSLYHTEDVPQDMVDRRVEVVARLKSLEESAAPPISFLQNATLVQELSSDKQYNLQMLNDRFQIGAEQIEALYQYAKFQFECGHYSGAADYLYQYRALCTDSERSLSALWGKLAAEILMQNWDVALEELNWLKEIIDSKNFVSPLNQLQNRIWLMHWSLFIFNHENGRNAIIGYSFKTACFVHLS
ncbi:eukaryotic translation initiation factor 3 subunit E [Cinnamomum micranthum f. kanehirae]|uniref:Eukaryotic translation initiation factor 3 subunit E n=1 Tax=Cinnamomum micranthum f. kanehirae TaxID=337451 RepID=A0A3S3PXE7_9MAGN|nr:eukaryotic translation initiation factor 3 subunit E [Cinnamomum micranthum f. kanehirae]